MSRTRHRRDGERRRRRDSAEEPEAAAAADSRTNFADFAKRAACYCVRAEKRHGDATLRVPAKVLTRAHV